MFPRSYLLFCLLLNIGINISIFANDSTYFIGEKYTSIIEQDLEDNLLGPMDSKFGTDTGNNYHSYNNSIIIALNKITARSQKLKLAIGEPQYFGNIEIKLFKCLKNNDPYSLQSNALLSVIEDRIDEERSVLFQGWIGSSSISLSTFEHPVYEIFLKDCQ